MGQVGEIEFSHIYKNESFYRVWVSAERLSGSVDKIPTIVSVVLLDLKQIGPGCNVAIEGAYRSQNVNHRLKLQIVAKRIELSCETHINKVFLDGYICMQPVYRKTPLGREVTEAMIAVNRPNKKTDYIPCIFWGRNTQYVSTLAIGVHLSLDGRIQSRGYQKQINGTDFKMTAYEVSASNVYLAEEDK